MPESKIYPFASNDTGSNLLTDSAYQSDGQRLIGNQPGIARSQLVNKALRQSSLLAAAIAHFLVESRGVDVNDAMTHEAIATLLTQAINDMIAGTSPPSGYETTGLVAFFPRSTPPMNWLRCNGAAVSRTTYSNLFGVVGTLFGVGDGSTTFNLPDLRGEFIRGLDEGRGVDPGRALGTWQKGTLVALDSTSTGRAVNMARGTQALIGGDDYLNSLYAGVIGTFLATSYTYTMEVSHGEFAVTRPRNVALLPCIKY